MKGKIVAADIEQAGQYYKDGRFKEAFEIYLRAAEAGSSSCQRFVGWMYFSGEGVRRDLESALKWLSAAAATADPEAEFGVGRVYAARGEFQCAVEWYRKSAAQGFPPGMFRLALMYELGKGVAIDKRSALSLYESAARGGHIRSARQEAVLLLKGQKGLLGRIKGLALFLRFLGSTIKLAVTDRDSPRLMS